MFEQSFEHCFNSTMFWVAAIFLYKQRKLLLDIILCTLKYTVYKERRHFGLHRLSGTITAL